jgi:hypothetical protein
MNWSTSLKERKAKRTHLVHIEYAQRKGMQQLITILSKWCTLNYPSGWSEKVWHWREGIKEATDIGHVSCIMQVTNPARPAKAKARLKQQSLGEVKETQACCPLTLRPPMAGQPSALSVRPQAPRRRQHTAHNLSLSRPRGKTVGRRVWWGLINSRMETCAGTGR